MDAMTPDNAATATRAQITVARTSDDDVQQRQIVVKVDGERIGELMFGETLTIPVRAGRHELMVDNTWNRKKLEVVVAAGEQVKFRTVSRAGRFTWFLVGMLGAGPIYVSVEREDKPGAKPPAVRARQDPSLRSG
jgi:hypothetical protein